MTLGRRAALSAPALLLARASRAQPGGPAVRVAALRFGTLAWELDVIREHGLAQGVTIEPVEFAASQATQLALQAGRVEAALLDWTWVARQRAVGADWTCAPTSAAAGAIVAPQASPVRALADLPGRRLGIAGSSLDKSWLILRAHARQRLGVDLDSAVERSFGPPPLLGELLAAGRLDAALTYWPYAARAEAAGLRRVLSVADMVQALGIATPVPFVGLVFSEAWGRANGPALDGLLRASAAARDLLRRSDAEWQRIAPLTGAAGPAELAALTAWYREGALPPGSAPTEAAARLYAVLAEIGGPALVGPARSLPPGTFWA